MTKRTPAPAENAGPPALVFSIWKDSDENWDMLMYEPPRDASSQKSSKLRPLSFCSASSSLRVVSVCCCCSIDGDPGGEPERG